jgi:hypothetical protein
VTLALGRLRASGEIAMDGRVIILTGLAADLVGPRGAAAGVAEAHDARVGGLQD